MSDADFFTTLCNDGFGRIPPEKLDSMSLSGLEKYLDWQLSRMTEETYDAELIDLILNALERKSPSKEIDTEKAYARFCNRMGYLANRPKKQHTIRKPVVALRIGLVAMLAVMLTLGTMIVAQAAGIDVFGAIASWTEEVFSFGRINDDGTADDLSTKSNSVEGNALSQTDCLEYGSVQDVLNAFGIVEVMAPTKIPADYSLVRLSVTESAESNTFILSASYKTFDNDYLGIEIMRYTTNPQNQIEKVSGAVDSTSINGVTVSVVKNDTNYTLAWYTDNYECYISGVSQETLQEIATSMIIT